MPRRPSVALSVAPFIAAPLSACSVTCPGASCSVSCTSAKSAAAFASLSASYAAAVPQAVAMASSTGRGRRPNPMRSKGKPGCGVPPPARPGDSASRAPWVRRLPSRSSASSAKAAIDSNSSCAIRRQWLAARASTVSARPAGLLCTVTWSPNPSTTAIELPRGPPIHPWSSGRCISSLDPSLRSTAELAGVETRRATRIR